MGDVNWSLGFTLPNPVVRSNDLKIYIYIYIYLQMLGGHQFLHRLVGKRNQIFQLSMFHLCLFPGR